MGSSPWVLDLYAWFHSTFDLRLLRDVKMPDLGEIAEALPPWEQKPLPVLGRGSVQTGLVKVPDVHYIQGEENNVISVAQLSRVGLDTVFEQQRCCVKDRETGEIVGRAHLRNGVYVVDYLLIGHQDETTSLLAPGPNALQEGDAAVAAAAKSEWVLDFFAWNHETSDLQLLHDLRLLQTPQEIADHRPRQRDDDLLLPSFLWCGSVSTELFDVPDVRYNPGEATNVISVAQLARRHGLDTIIFKKKWCYVRDPTTGQNVGRARARDGLYVLDYLLIGQQDVVDSRLPLDISSVADDHHESENEQEQEGERPEKRDRFGLSRFGRSNEDGDLRELPIKVGPDYVYACASATSDETAGLFIVDTGATHHMTADKDLLKSSYMNKDDRQFPQDIVKRVMVANGQFTAVCGVGNMYTDAIKLEDVLHVEKMEVGKLLVSARQLMDLLEKQLDNHLWNHEYRRLVEYLKQPASEEPINKVASLLHDMNVPMFLIDEIARHIGELGVTAIVGLVREMEFPRTKIDDIARYLQNKMNVPQLLTDELCRQEVAWRRIKRLAHEVCEAEVRFRMDDVLVTVVENLQVGCGVRVGRLYHLLEMRPCPPVRMLVESDRWVLAEVPPPMAT